MKKLDKLGLISWIASFIAIPINMIIWGLLMSLTVLFWNNYYKNKKEIILLILFLWCWVILFKLIM
jgi:hypothetical protein